MRRALRTLGPTLAALGLAVGLGLPTAAIGLSSGARTTASTIAVEVIVPGGAGAQAGTDSSGSYSDSIVSVGSFSSGRSVLGEHASASSRLSGVSVLGGLITAGSLESAVTAQGGSSRAGTHPSGTFSSAASGLVIDGVAAGGSNARVDLPDGLGYAVSDERVVLSPPGSGAYRAFEVALHVHLTSQWQSYPAGTEILLGYADAGAEAPAAPTPSTSSSGTTPPSKSSTPANPSTPATPPSRGGGSQTAPGSGAVPGTPPVVPGVLPTGMPGNSNGIPANIEDPPPGGFSANPPVDPAIKAKLLAGGYVFPVVGGARFSDDWGAPRSDTGFHQGIDLMAPLGTPVVAVSDGTLVAVGWNRLGGHRLWLRDTDGNYFYYAHLSAYAPLARPGAKVHAGDVLGFVGNTGDAAGGPFHMHFEIHPAGRWAIPPFAYVTSWLNNAGPFAAQAREISAQASLAPATAPPLVSLGSTDISSASGLDPGAVVAAASPGEPTTADDGSSAVFGGLPAPTAQSLLAPATKSSPFALRGLNP
jgi:murein DD-endopeptidase MepM/ murein hydrolase activator NlpD